MIKGDISQIPNSLLEKFQANKIDEIIITGMGTCYTAALAISANMRNHPAIQQSKIIIRPLLASELSAFHIREDMKSTLLIGIAQSGTTIDTNVAVKMVKRRGAYTLAILNKRQGDISYLVDTTLYLGNGRDIEIAVPSTKTYICHILVGYILTKFFGQVIKNNKENDSVFNNELINLPQHITDTIENYNSINLELCLNKFLQFTNWYVVYDSYKSFIVGMEARIKLSECCYQSIPLLSIEEYVSLDIKNSIAIYLTNSDETKIQNFIDKVSCHDNQIILIGQREIINKVESSETTVTKIYYQAYSEYSAMISTIINCQLLSYHIALKIDSRQNYFMSIVNDINSNHGYKIRLQKLLMLIEKNDVRVKGYQSQKLDSLKNNIKKLLSGEKSDLNTIKAELYYLARYSMRPIDAIKHQAKTITVGTHRDTKINNNKGSTIFSDYRKSSSFNSINRHMSNNATVSHKPIACLVGDDIDHKLLKFMINFLNGSRSFFDSIPKFYYSSTGNGKADYASDITFRISNNIEDKTYDNEIKSLNEYFLYDNPKFEKVRNKLYSIIGDNSNEEINSIVSGFITSLSILDSFMSNSDNQFSSYVDGLIEQIKIAHGFSNSSDHQLGIEKISNMIKNSKNIKFLGSGVNYDAAKNLAVLSIKKFSKPFAFDVLENHKHIDMSAEPLIINILSNILDDSYQDDAYSEIQKANAHNNIPVVITNSFDNRFDKTDICIIKIPYVSNEISLLTYLILFNKLLF